MASVHQSIDDDSIARSASTTEKTPPEPTHTVPFSPDITKIPFSDAHPPPTPPSWLERLNPFRLLPSWLPTSTSLLFEAESRVLRLVDARLERFYVEAEQHRLWTLIASAKEEREVEKPTPLVMLHGMGGGCGVFAMNLGDLALHRTVYCCDLLGFGLSSRPDFGTDPQSVVDEFVESLEAWRQAVRLNEPFVLLGHSFGGYVAANYAIKHPEALKHLVLAEPWGVPRMPTDRQIGADWPLWIRALRVVLQSFNPFAGLRVAGPWGPSLFKKIRPDFQRRFARFYDDDTINDYVYHLNAQSPSGETAFKTLTAPWGFAKLPLVDRIREIKDDVPLTIVYGETSWMDSDSGQLVRQERKASDVDVITIPAAGHQLFMDQPLLFNEIVNGVGRRVDAGGGAGRGAGGGK